MPFSLMTTSIQPELRESGADPNADPRFAFLVHPVKTGSPALVVHNVNVWLRTTVQLIGGTVSVHG